MLSLLADALMIATRFDPMPTHKNRTSDADWSDRFMAARMQGLDESSRRFNARCDLNW